MENATPFISVIVPAYNAEQTLEACLGSLKAQTFPNWEAVCVNDGSTDNTLDMLRSLAAQDARIRVLSQPNAGPSAARNAAIDAAQGEIVMFLDCDDWYQPNACETVRQAFADNDVDIMAFGATCVPESAAPKHVRNLLSPNDEVIEGFNPDVLFSKNAQPYIARIAARRSFLQKNRLRFADGVHLAEDAALLFEAYPQARKTVLSSAKLYNYRMQSGSITHEANGENAVRAKIDQHLAAMAHILSYWTERGIEQACPERMVSWCLDFTLFDISHAPGSAQAEYIAKLDKLLKSAYPAYEKLPLKNAVAKEAQKVAAHNAEALFNGNAAKLDFVRFFVATRGLKQCIERFI